jgi:hypothetical protein
MVASGQIANLIVADRHVGTRHDHFDLVPSASGGKTIATLAWARAALLSAGAVVCLAGCVTAAPIPPTYTQDELRATCERNGFRWYRDDLTGGFCARR